MGDSGSSLGNLAASSQATGAETHTDLFAFLHDLGRLDISYPAVVGAPLRVAYVMAKLACFATIIASHLSVILL